jgi:hypothetical protein
MGHLELFAQQTFAEETERITKGAAGWQDPPEIRLEKVQIMSPSALCAPMTRALVDEQHLECGAAHSVSASEAGALDGDADTPSTASERPSLARGVD